MLPVIDRKIYPTALLADTVEARARATEVHTSYLTAWLLIRYFVETDATSLSLSSFFFLSFSRALFVVSGKIIEASVSTGYLTHSATVKRSRGFEDAAARRMRLFGYRAHTAHSFQQGKTTTFRSRSLFLFSAKEFHSHVCHIPVDIPLSHCIHIAVPFIVLYTRFSGASVSPLIAAPDFDE